MKVAFAGMSHLGVCLSIAAHDWGCEVVGFDVDLDRTDQISRGDFDPAEPGVAEFLASGRSHYRVTTDVGEVTTADLVFVAVDTVLQEEGTNDESEVAALLTAVCAAAPATTPIVIASQVRPGFTRAHAHLHPLIFYFMETLIFGRGLERARHPERYIIGCPEESTVLPQALGKYLALAACPIHVMTYESAELSKLAANFILAAQISAANSLAELAAHVGGNWMHMEQALRDDSRIGGKAYISAGLGIGGANIVRDLYGIQAMAEQAGANPEMAALMLRHSGYMRNWVLRILGRVRQSRPIERVAVLGLAYKPGTQSTRGGAGVPLVEVLGRSLCVNVHDPVVRRTFDESTLVTQWDRVGDWVGESDVIVVATPYPEYRVQLASLVTAQRAITIIDPYRLLDPAWGVADSLELIQMGVSRD